MGDFSAIDVGVGLAETLPTGLYSGTGHRRLRGGSPLRRQSHQRLPPLDKELYLTATDLDTCERIVFGEDGWSDVPISKAVQCSTALPIVYKPVDLKGRQLIDGGIRSTTNVDIAVEKGAKFIIVVNPLVPFVNDFEKTMTTVFGNRVRRVSDMGLPAIANQTFRLIAHARLHEAVSHWEEKYPGVDIILIEPEPNDELMFGTPIMDYSRRLQIARHGFESVTATLAQDYDRYKEIAERHGLEISERRVRRVVERAAEEESEQSSAWRRVLDQTTSALLRQSGEASSIGADANHHSLVHFRRTRFTERQWVSAADAALNQIRHIAAFATGRVAPATFRRRLPAGSLSQPSSGTALPSPRPTSSLLSAGCSPSAALLSPRRAPRSRPRASRRRRRA